MAPVGIAFVSSAVQAIELQEGIGRAVCKGLGGWLTVTPAMLWSSALVGAGATPMRRGPETRTIGVLVTTLCTML